LLWTCASLWTRIADIVNEKRAITADTALRFARYFNNSPTFWMNLQTRYDLGVAEDEIADKVVCDVRPWKQRQQGSSNYG
jgi:antitoxin HigA-1